MMRLCTLAASAGLASLPCLARADIPAPPSAEAIKQCIEQFDTGNRWEFTWELLEIGKPRHPQNNFEALAPLGGEGRRAEFGYPVHARYNLGGITTIDAMYWVVRDAQGVWTLPPLCRMTYLTPDPAKRNN